MSAADPAWEERMADLWRGLDGYPVEDFVARVDALAAGLPPSAVGIGLFERASARDSTGCPDQAVPLYREALAAGLGGIRRRRANIQLASSLRSLGHPAEAVELLTAELHAADDELNGAVRAFLALSLVDVGREREAVAHSLVALSAYLPRYHRSLARYAHGLAEIPGEFRGV